LSQNILREIYRKSRSVSELAEILHRSDHLLVRGLHASSKAAVTAATTELVGGQHLIISPDKESAAYFYNDLESLFDEREMDYNLKQVLFYPTSYKRPYEPEKPDNTYILSRTEVLGRMNSSNRKTLIVTYPEALSEKVVTRQYLSHNTIKIKTGAKLALDSIADTLYNYSFERVDFVVEPGQFAIRGGLLDVFSFSNDHPYRIEFFGDEIESIRTFEITSQLSVQKINRITLLPNVQDRLIHVERQSLLDYLPEKTTIWIEEAADFIYRVNGENTKALHAFEKMDSADLSLKPELLFTTGEILWEKLQQMHSVEIGLKSTLNATDTIAFNTSAQPSFNKNFKLLISDLLKHIKAGYSSFILSDNKKQIERLSTIFEDIQSDLPKNERATFQAIYHSLQGGFIDHEQKICCYTDHQIFERYHKFHLRESFSSKDAITLRELYDLKPGDYVTHIDHGIGRFDGLEIIDNNGKMQEAIRLTYKNNDLLYVSIHSLHRIAKYTGSDGIEPSLNKLGSNAWTRLKNKAKSRVKDIARDLIKLYAARKASKGFQFMPDTYLQTELEASFIYEDTPDQLKSTNDVKADMESPAPMDRLVCGDVGFGKTEIAIRAAFKAVNDSKQVALLVPTTILAIQHFKTFSDRLADLPANVDYINRFRSTKQQNETLKKLKEGKIDILIGTHRLISKDVTFKDLGLLIIDEEQKFGVAAKEKLKQIKANVDTLTLTATPIPRTLQFSMMGARDLSIINTPPPNRYPVQTEIRSFGEEVIRNAITYEVARGGQVFFVHNRVQNIMDVYDMLMRFVPGISIGIAHGQMEGRKLEQVMLDFIDGHHDLLLSTTIVESGLDIPNANTIIINDAHHYGLSDLHQLRGRVGRSNKKAFCFLLAPPRASLSSEAQKRLRAIEEFSELGSGINIAMRDLDIRGAGNLLGGEQSGFINEIGFETFHKILDEAIRELKESEFRNVFNQEETVQFVRDCVIETDMEILMPADYIESGSERIKLYSELDNISHDSDLMKFTDKMIDRFGSLPKQAIDLINTIRLRWLARDLGFEKLVLKNNMLTAYFITNQESGFFNSETFSNIIKFVQHHPKICRMKETNQKLILTLTNIKTINAAINALDNIKNFEKF
jgi:transcription-repair coupling factor (superfamily II helicase)